VIDYQTIVFILKDSANHSPASYLSLNTFFTWSQNQFRTASIFEKIDSQARYSRYIQGKRADKKLARGEVPPLLLKIDGVVGLETAFAFLKMAPGS